MQQSTRKFETGLPLFSGLDLGLILDAQAQIKRNEFHGLTAMVETLGKTGSMKIIRKLAAIWKASDIELKAAEANGDSTRLGSAVRGALDGLRGGPLH